MRCQINPTREQMKLLPQELEGFFILRNGENKYNKLFNEHGESENYQGHQTTFASVNSNILSSKDRGTV